MKKNQITSLLELLGGLLGVLILSALFMSCDQNCLEGQGPIKTQTISMDEFSGINVSGSIDVKVQPGETQNVQLRGNENIFPFLNRRVFNDTWDIYLEDVDCSRNYVLEVLITSPYIDTYIVNGSGDIDVVAFDSLENLTLAVRGSGDISCSGMFNVREKTNIEIDGSGNIQVGANTQTITTKIDGSGNVEVTGLADLQVVMIEGSGDYYGFDLQSTLCDVTIDGSGDTEVNVQEVLNVTIEGSGNVYYKGDPSITEKGDGSGEVIRR